MAAKKTTAQDAKRVMLQIRKLAHPYPVAQVQSRLDEIVKLAKGACCSAPKAKSAKSLNREEPSSTSSADRGEA